MIRPVYETYTHIFIFIHFLVVLTPSMVKSGRRNRQVMVLSPATVVILKDFTPVKKSISRSVWIRHYRSEYITNDTRTVTRLWKDYLDTPLMTTIRAKRILPQWVQYTISRTNTRLLPSRP